MAFLNRPPSGLSRPLSEVPLPMRGCIKILLPGRPTTVDDEIGSSHVGGRVGGEKRRARRYSSGLAIRPSMVRWAYAETKFES